MRKADALVLSFYEETASDKEQHRLVRGAGRKNTKVPPFANSGTADPAAAPWSAAESGHDYSPPRIERGGR
jgi:hypothetical protein